MPNIETPKGIRLLPVAVIKNMVILSTSGFGLVVALAWNQLVQATVQRYIDPYLGKDSGIISLLIYAVVMTVLAVTVTMQLSILQQKLEGIEERAVERVLEKARQRQKNGHVATQKLGK